MLDSLRKGVGTWFVKAFLFLLVASFAVWGIGDIFRGRTDSAVVTVGDAKIEPQQFTDAFNREVRRMSQAMGQSLDREQAKSFGLVERTLQQLVTQALYDAEARELGLAASRDAILQQIRENPAFRNEFGQFDRFRFEQLLRENGFNEASFVAANQRDLTRAQLFEAVVGGAQPPRQLVEFFYRRQQERRVAQVATVPASAFADVGEPDQATLEKFHAERATRFTAPEYRAISFVTLRPEDLIDEMHASESEVAAEYEDRLSELSTPEVREVEQILFETEDAARKAADRIKAGESFYDVAKDAAGQSEAATKLGEQRREDLLPEAADAIFALAQGAASAPVKTAFGWHVFRVTKVAAGRKPTLDEAKPRLVEELKRRRAAEAMFDMANRIDDALAGGSSLEDLSKQFKLRYVKLGAVDPDGRNARGESIDSLPSSQALLAAIFSTEKGAEPQLREFEDGGYFVLRVDEVTPPALRPLAQVRQEAVEVWKAEARLAAAGKRAAELAEKAKQADLADLAREAGLGFQRTDPQTRQEAAGSQVLSFEAAQALFSLEVGGTATAGNREGDGHLAIKLVEIRPADPSADQAGVARLREQLRASMSDDLLTGFRGALERQIDVRVNEQAIAAMFDSGR